jgi:allantoin racemase
MTYHVKVITPIPMDAAALARRASQLPAKHILPGFEVEYVPALMGGKYGDGYYDGLASEIGTFGAGLKAAAEGCDALGIDTISDSFKAFNALRSRLTIPVVAPGITTYNIACNLGHKFSIITMWDEWFHYYKKSLTQYGLAGRCASMRSINTRPDLEELLEGKEEVIFGKLEAVANKCIEEDKADVIVLGSTTMHQSYDYLRERLPVPVVNPGLIMWKMIEMYLQLGVAQSKQFYQTPIDPIDDKIFTV